GATLPAGRAASRPRPRGSGARASLVHRVDRGGRGEGAERPVRIGAGKGPGGHGPPAGWCYERFPVLVHPTQWPRAASTPKMPPSQSVLRPYWVSSRTEPNRSSLGLTYIRSLLSGDGLRATGPRS